MTHTLTHELADELADELTDELTNTLMDTLRDARPAGRPVRIARDGAIDLDGREQAWLVVRGEVEVYTRDLDALSRTGSGTEIATIHRRREGLIGRRFLLTASTGTVIWSFDGRAADHGVQVLGTGEGAELVAVTRTALLEALSTSESATLWRGLARWIDAIAATIVPGDECLHPGELEPGAMISIDRFGIVRPLDGLQWVTANAGTAALLGRDELQLADGGYLPVTRHCWLQAAERPATVATLDARDGRASSIIVDAMSAFHDGALAAGLADVRTRARREFERLATRARRERAELGDSFEVLASAVTGRTSHRDEPRSDDALFEACRLVAADAGVSLTTAASSVWRQRMREPVEAIASAARVRVRGVTLRGTWWTDDHGSLVVFRQHDRAPLVARRERRGYVLRDPLTGAESAVTGRDAVALLPTAYMFLPSLGRQQRGLRALWSLGAWAIRRELAWVLALSAITAGLATITPMVTRVLVDQIIPQAERSQVPLLTGLLAAITVMVALFSTVQRFVLLRVEALMELHMEAAVMDRLLRLPLAFFRRFLAGDLADRAGGIAAIRMALSGSALSGLLHGVFAVTSLLVLLAFDASLAMVGAVLSVVALGVVTTSTVLAVHHQRQIADRAGRGSGLLLQLISAIAKFRVAGAERRVFALWAETFAGQRALQIRAAQLQNRFQLFRAAYPLLSLAAFFTVLYASQGTTTAARVSTGTFIAAYAAYAQFTNGILLLGTTLLSVLQVVPQWERVAPILQASEEVRAEAADPGTLRGGVEFRQVGFRYAVDGPVVLDQVSFRADPGEMVALVGPSGSGKSTVVRLLLGLEQPATGSILLDGQDLTTLDLTTVRQQLGVVTQAARVMPGNLVGNILGPWNLTETDAWRAARLAGLASDIEAMPMGMHTVIGEGGGTFSGGQLQRLLIARALVHGPRLIVLDEATSALDNATQRQVADCLDRLAVTRIVIAHRLSTIRRAHRIYVMAQGRIVETGTYDALMARNGVFASMARRQLS